MGSDTQLLQTRQISVGEEGTQQISEGTKQLQKCIVLWEAPVQILPTVLPAEFLGVAEESQSWMQLQH